MVVAGCWISSRLHDRYLQCDDLGEAGVVLDENGGLTTGV